MHRKAQGKQAAALKPDEAHAIIGTDKISRRSFYNALNRNEIPHVRLGRRILIPRAAFETWLQTGGFTAEEAAR